jgi:hypothetical protein
MIRTRATSGSLAMYCSPSNWISTLTCAGAEKTANKTATIKTSFFMMTHSKEAPLASKGHFLSDFPGREFVQSSNSRICDAARPGAIQIGLGLEIPCWGEG